MAGTPAGRRDRREALEERRARRAAVTDAGVVMEAAALLLATRSRSVAETRRRLLTLGYPAPLVEEVLARLEQMGYLDDAAFAAAWVASRDRSRPRGAAALGQELRRKGIDDTTVRTALADRESSTGSDRDGAEADDETDTPGSADLAAARRLLDRKGAALRREPDPRKRRQKAYALLARNGFDPEICRRSLSWLEDGADVEGSEDPGDGP